MNNFYERMGLVSEEDTRTLKAIYQRSPPTACGACGNKLDQIAARQFQWDKGGLNAISAGYCPTCVLQAKARDALDEAMHGDQAQTKSLERVAEAMGIGRPR